MYNKLRKIAERHSLKTFMVLSVLLLSIVLFSTMFSNGLKEPVNKEVLGYYSIWSKTADWSNLSFGNISTLALFNIAPLENGDLQDDYDSVIPDELITIAHDNGVKVIISFGPTVGDTAVIDSILGNTSSNENTLNNILGIIQRHNFDGIDLDIESVNPINSITGESNKMLMTNFVRDLKTKLNAVNPDYRIYVAVGPYYQDEDKIFDLRTLQNYVNYVMMMNYNYYGSWSSTAGPNSPYNDNGNGYYDTIKHYEGEMNKSKLLFGVPWYGYEWKTVNNERLAERDINGRFKIIGYKNYIDFVDGYNKNWDDEWKTPWYTRKQGDQWIEGYYEDIQSLEIKYDFAISEDLGGVGIWQLGYGTGREELWQLLKDKFVTR